ncbi:MAG: pirin family protein [Actinomycetota bacterium]
MSDAIELTIEPRTRPVGNGSVRRLLPFRLRRMVGPFVFCDLFGPEDLAPGQGMNVDAHPHIGLSTLTYLLAGRAVHRDSTGAVQDIEAGAVNWMTAGSGVTHTERSHPDDVASTVPHFGVQTWVALPDGGEDVPAGFEHCPADAVPVDHLAGAQVRLAVGSGFGAAAPITGSSPLVLAELRLDDGALSLPGDHPERAVLALSDGLTLADRELPVGHLAVLDPAATPELRGTGTAMLLGGDPVGARHIWWNFVHSEPERIEEAKASWTDQRFPLVPGDHEPWVPLPGS